VNVQIEMLDRLLVPKLAQDLRVTQDGTLVLSYGKASEPLRWRRAQRRDRKKLKTLDRDLQESLLKLARSRRTAYLTVGHEELNDASRGSAGKSEQGVEIVQLALRKQNYTIKDLGPFAGSRTPSAGRCRHRFRARPNPAVPVRGGRQPPSLCGPGRQAVPGARPRCAAVFGRSFAGRDRAGPRPTKAEASG